MNAIVIDASVVAPLVLRDEEHPKSYSVEWFLTDGGGLAPAIWPFEVANLLISAERRQRMPADKLENALRYLLGLPIEQVVGQPHQVVAQLALRHRLTFYDASYLWLAIDRGVPLATLDAALVAAARREGVEFFGR